MSPKEPLALKHSTQLGEHEQKIKDMEAKIELLKTRLDASTRLGGQFLNDIQMLRIVLNLVIDEQTEKIIREKYPQFVWVLHNRANILKRLKR